MEVKADDDIILLDDSPDTTINNKKNLNKEGFKSQELLLLRRINVFRLY